MKRNLLLALTWVSLSCFAQQTNFTIKGSVVDNKGKV